MLHTTKPSPQQGAATTTGTIMGPTLSNLLKKTSIALIYLALLTTTLTTMTTTIKPASALVASPSESQIRVLTPPYFNLAFGKRIVASSTCGVNSTSAELFCRLTGVAGDTKESDQRISINSGQLCEECDPAVPSLSHHAQLAIDGTERWWQSPPLSRGMEYNAVNVTIDLGQEFLVVYVFIKMANSPRPGVWALEKSTDFGKTWNPWQYFAGNPNECLQYFNASVSEVPQEDDQVICTTKFSKVVPLENGEIIVSLVDDRPSAQNFSSFQKLQDWTKATSVRLRLLQTKTLLGHLMAVRRQDPTVTRRYFYSIKDISIGGRCVCNGHADRCDKRDPDQPNKLFCQCHHNTCGSQCETCCPGFVQKKWQRATLSKDFVCERCNCHKHTDQCVYDADVDAKNLSLDIHGNYEGGGVCQNCTHNTKGINCEQCIDGYYRPYNVPKDVPNVCYPCQCETRFTTGSCEEGSGRCICKPQYTGQDCDRCNHGYHNFPECVPCDCHINGTSEGVCDVGGGQCPCKENFIGAKCDTCRPGYYSFPHCKECNCNRLSSQTTECDVTSGQCRCLPGFSGQNCSSCATGYHGFPSCTLCNCDVTGCTEDICDSRTGRCDCKPNYTGAKCDRCVSGYYGYPYCYECGCAQPGSRDTRCHANGQCVCKQNFSGVKCDKCSPGFYNYPQCIECNCDPYGSLGQTCDQVSGQCECRSNFDGLMCDQCKENFYRFPRCEECNCNPAGAISVPGQPLGGCGPGAAMSDKLCECKERVIGHICDSCKTGFWDLDSNNPLGCRKCDCHPAGTVGGINVCDGDTGQCMCKVDVEGRNCDQCKDGTYALNANNPFGCKACGCNVGGSASMNCNKKTGQCSCKPRVRGKKCDIPRNTYFYPTLHQQKYEVEDGYRPGGGKVYFAFDHKVFPQFSWMGYAIMSEKQPEVIVRSSIQKPSLYRLLVRYHNPSTAALTAKITLTPRIPTDTEQTATVTFDPSDTPTFSRASDSPLVLNPGRWNISIRLDPEDLQRGNLYLDYLVLVPQHYYEATVLQDRINRQCSIGDDKGPCLHYQYPELKGFSTILGIASYVEKNGRRENPNLNTNDSVVAELRIKGLADLNEDQLQLKFDVAVPSRGMYVLVVNYHNRRTGKDNVINVVGPSGISGGLELLKCTYSTLCRQVAKTDNEVTIFNFTSTTGTVVLEGNPTTNAFIESVTAIPVHLWNQGYIRPTIVCIKVNGVCAGSQYTNPADSDRIEAESEPNQDRIATDLPPGIWDTTVGLVKLNDSMPSLDVSGQVKTGQQVVVVHYYQPYEPQANIDVTIYSKDRVYTGTLKADHCASQTGCRGIITLGKKGLYHVDIMDKDFKISFNSTSGAQVWLDYIMLITSTKYAPEMLVFQPVDKSSDFLTECIDDSLKVKLGKETPKSCRTRLFALTTDFNNGAVSCGCNVDGSLSFICNFLGGQCRCRPNIIGRDCSACRPGYYGFPRCRKCRCRVGKCDPFSGFCVCPPFVTGAQCDSCVPHTFGYDPYVGCQECHCHPHGVVDRRDLSCNARNGQCSCKPNVEGRHCDSCAVGHYGFPHCRKCECDTQGAGGTLEQICDEASGVCLCKENTRLPTCDSCRPGAFYLERHNPKGCTSCFCFGTTTSCDRSRMAWTVVGESREWVLPDPEKGQGPSAASNDDDDENGAGEGRQGSNSAEGSSTSRVTQWSAPALYLGNRVTSYGGRFRFSLEVFSPRVGSGPIPTLPPGHVEALPEVVLTGNNVSVVHRARDFTVHDPTDATIRGVNVLTSFTVQLRESHFSHEGSVQGPVQRSQFMMVLVSLESIHIRLDDTFARLRLGNVTLEVATTTGGDRPAYTVEQCDCPSSYEGTSCEKCAPGHYRRQTTPFLGICSPCQCNGHADECDPVTGQCMGCRDNTEGTHCEVCLPGYYGDPTTGACKMCTCPLDSLTNNFAKTCSSNQRGLVTKCDCKPGYAGNHCERCDNGYYGEPTTLGERCAPCECSGNIDPEVEGSCDQVTGACYLCTNNATGSNCESCKDWWYGDAVHAKNCKPCDCDRCGTVDCGEFGTCQCKDNVIGINCDRCLANHWGYNDCDGCKRCDCGAASVSEQCDDHTGQCECREGVIGQKCDHCQSNYWNYQPSGCQKCQCMSEGSVTCDSETGACICQPGFRGANCSECDRGWIHVPGKGCIKCDRCTKFLTDELYDLSRNLTVTKRELDSVAVGAVALNSLRDIGQTSNILQPQVDVLLRGENPNLLSLEKKRALLLGLNSEVTVLGTNVKNIALRSQSVFEGIEEVEGKPRELNQHTQDVVHLIRVTIDYLKSLNAYTGPSVNLEEYVKSATLLMEELAGRNHSDTRNVTNAELKKAMEALQTVARVQGVSADPVTHFNRTRDVINAFREKLYDLQERSRNSGHHSSSAINIVQELNNSLSMNARHGINQTMTTIGQLITATRTMVRDIYTSDEDLKEHTAKLTNQLQHLSGYEAGLESYIDAPVGETQEKVGMAVQHSDSVLRDLHSLDSIYVNTKTASDTSVSAANSYKNIISAIEDASAAASQAWNVSQLSHRMSQGVGARSMTSKTTSHAIKSNATVAYQVTAQDLADQLSSVRAFGDRVEAYNTEIEDKLQQFRDLYSNGDTNSTRAIVMRSMEASRKAQAVLKQAARISDEDREMMSSIPLQHSATNESVWNSLKQVSQARQVLPDISSMIQEILSKKDATLSYARNASLSMKELRTKIELARSQANQILVGLKFANSAVQLRNPPNVDSSGSYTKVSMHVKTRASNGLLTYIGGPRLEVRPQDYLSLEVANGRVMFRFDLGSGPGIVYHSRAIDDGQWHYIEAERIGTVGSLKVVTEGEEVTKVNGTSGGTNSVLMLRQSQTNFFVGGYPHDMQLPGDITRERYWGDMERFEYNDYPMGLWDFVWAENNRDGAIGRLIERKTFNGYRFDGESYFELKTPRNVQKRFDISLSFNTFKPNGLLLLMYDTSSQDFASIDLRDGRIVYQYDLGGGRAFVASTNRYNDGKWHQVQIKRQHQNGHLGIDSLAEEHVTLSPGSLKMLAVKKLFVGGYSDYLDMPRSNVSNFGFNGCIKNLQFNTDSTGFENKILAHKVIPGCPEQVVRGVNFPPPGKNYVSKYIETAGSAKFHLTMKVRTEQADGLLMFAYSATDKSQYLTLSVSAGYITVRKYTEEGVKLRSKLGNYNDGNWHYISVVSDGHEMTLNVNDLDMAVSRSTSGLNSDLQLHFGGIPPDVEVPGDVPVVQFFGCIEDVTINGLFFNFARATHSKGVRLNICPLDISTTVPSTSVVPATPPPTLPPGQCALPRTPAVPDSYMTSGHRFGATSNDSRWEVYIRNRNNRKNHLSLEFQTMTPDGVLLYAADKRHNDFISIYLRKGKVTLAYNCGSGVATVTTSATYNDGKWHDVTILRFNKQGTMRVDGGKALRTLSPGTTSSLDITRIYSFGGLSLDNQGKAKKNLGKINQQFVGCLRNIKANKKTITEDSSKSFSVEPCSGMAEFGTFFTDGYVKLYDKFHIGTDLEISMEIKPRSMTGILFAVHGKEDFMLVQIVKGAVKVSFDNGIGVVMAATKPQRNNQICNGQWHKIKVTKSKTLASLTVDNVKVPLVSGRVGASSADTNHPLYIGGIPAGSSRKGVEATGPYVGCIRNVEFRDKSHVLAAGEPSGELKFGFCPTI